MTGAVTIGRAESLLGDCCGRSEVLYPGSGKAFAEIILPDPNAFDFRFLQQVIDVPESLFLASEVPSEPGSESFPGPSDIQIHPFFIIVIREFPRFYFLDFCQFNE